MMLRREISIIIPAYNCETTIDRCVKSLIQDKEVILEIIIINDGSTDNTFNKLKVLSDKNPLIKIINSSNKGSGSARNIGLSYVSGKFVYFMDADDFIDTDYLINMYNVFKNHEVDFVSSSYKNNNNNNIKEEKIYFKSGEYDKDKLKENFYSSLVCDTSLESKVPKTLWNKLFNRQFLLDNEIKFDEKLLMSQDVVFTTKAFLCAKSIFYLPSNCGYNYVLNLDSRTHVCVPNIFQIMKINYQIVAELTIENKDYDLSRQLPYLLLRNTMTAIANLGKKNHLTYRETKDIIRTICNDELVMESINLVRTTDFSIYRKLLFHFIKNKNINIIVILTFIKGFIDK